MIGHSVHLGPYIKIKLLKNETTKDKISCQNTECKVFDLEKYKPDKFCSICGKEYETTQIPYTDMMNFSKWVYGSSHNRKKYGNTFMHRTGSKFDFIMSNKMEMHGRKLRLEDITGDIDLINMDKIKELNEFRKKYAKPIESMKLFFGEENVSIHWGIVTYYE